jgi:hypothetical protein
MTQAIREAVIEPMLALYVPPSHLRHDGQAQEQALAAYQKALAGFDRDTLQRGWEKIVSHNTYWAWPTPAEIAQACRQCQPRPKPPGEEEQRKEKALGMAEAYTAHYMKTSYLARLARQEGWAGRLREYVADAAWVQGQLIAGVRSIGCGRPAGRRHRPVPLLRRGFRRLPQDDRQRHRARRDPCERTPPPRASLERGRPARLPPDATRGCTSIKYLIVASIRISTVRNHGCIRVPDHAAQAVFVSASFPGPAGRYRRYACTPRP